jgi:hypothetical protein
MMLNVLLYDFSSVPYDFNSLDCDLLNRMNSSFLSLDSCAFGFFP